MDRLARMTNTKKLVLRIAKPQDSGRYVAGNDSTNEAIRIVNRLNSPTLRIEASVGRMNGKLAHTKEFIKELFAMDADNEIDVKTLQITGEIDEEPTFVDLIEDKIVAEVSVEPGSRRTLPYLNRKASLRAAWAEKLPELRHYGVTS